MPEIKIRQSNEAIFCPYCGVEITELIVKEAKSAGIGITAKSVYACSKCKKIIPVSHSTYAF